MSSSVIPKRKHLVVEQVGQLVENHRRGEAGNRSICKREQIQSQLETTVYNPTLPPLTTDILLLLAFYHGLFVDEDCASNVPSLCCHRLAHQDGYSSGGDPLKTVRMVGTGRAMSRLQGATDRACPFSLPDRRSSAFVIAIWKHRLAWMSTCSASNLFFNEICFWSRMAHSLWCLKISADLSWL